MIEVVLNYKNFLEELPEILSKSKYKMEYFIEKLNVSTPTFYRKLREKKFTINEVELLSKELYPQEYYEMLFMKELEESIKQAENGQVKSNKDVLEEMHNRIQKLTN